jgi:hypothetical protein
MNSVTGHLVVDLSLVETVYRSDYDLVPKSLRSAALQELAGRQETHVDLHVPTPLSKFAAKRRKVKRKIAKASRRRNR